MRTDNKKVNIAMFSMSTFADWNNGIANRNLYVLKELVRHPMVDKVITVDFIHSSRKRLIKDYLRGIVFPRYGSETVWRSHLSRCVKVSAPHLGFDKDVYVWSTIEQWRDSKNILFQLKVVLEKLNMMENLITWSYNPLFTENMEMVSPILTVFDTVDNWTKHSSFTKLHKQLLKNYAWIAKKTDVIFTVSQNLLAFYAGLGRERDVFFIPNGVDFESASSSHVLSKQYSRFFKRLPHPVLGYLGSITKDRVDARLLSYLASEFSDASIVLAGPLWPVWSLGKKEVKKDIEKHKNIYFLGRVPVVERFAVMREFDVCLNPHQDNEFIHSTDPMKVYEYLALGKPVVSTKFSGHERFSHVVWFAETQQEFASSIRTALSERHGDFVVSKRIAWAKENGYRKRVGEMLTIVFNAL